MAQVPIIAGNNKCAEHNSKIVFACKECNEELACLACVTSLHHGHKLVKIEDLAVAKKEEIQKYVSLAEGDKIPYVNKQISSVDAQVENNKGHTIKISQEIERQGNFIKTKIDVLTNKFVDACTAADAANRDLLSSYRNELLSLCSQLEDKVKNCNYALESQNHVFVYNVALDTKKELVQPTYPLLQNLIFTTGPFPDQLSKDHIGFLCSMYDSKIENEFIHTADVTSMANTGSDLVLLSNCEEKSISHVTAEGEIKDLKVQVNTFVKSICASPLTGNIWYCGSYSGMLGSAKNAVYEVISPNPIYRFSIQNMPYCICVTKEEVVVSTDTNITVFTNKGKIMRQSSGVSSPRNMAISVNTGDVAVCSEGSTCDERKFLAVLDSSLDQKNKYFGLSESLCHSFKSDFHPIDVAYDSQNRILVADTANKSVHLLSCDAKVVAIVHRDNLEITAMCLCPNGLLFLGHAERKVKAIKIASCSESRHQETTSEVEVNMQRLDTS